MPHEVQQYLLYFIAIQIDEKWQELVVRIVHFFVPGSVKHTSLVQLLKGGVNVPTTEGILGGKPLVVPHASRNQTSPVSCSKTYQNRQS